MAKIRNFGKSMIINIFLFSKSLRGICTQDLQPTSSILSHDDTSIWSRPSIQTFLRTFQPQSFNVVS